jgi:hypothetical protein
LRKPEASAAAAEGCNRGLKTGFVRHWWLAQNKLERFLFFWHLSFNFEQS